MVDLQPRDRRVRRRVGLRGGLPVDPRPLRRDGPPEDGAAARASTSTATTVEWEADEIEARMFQHELDHLHGVLMFDRMTPDQRREALAEYRRLQESPADRPGAAAPPPPALTAVRLAFLGTPEMAVPPLRALVAAGHDVVARRHPRRPPPGPGERHVAEPGQGRRARARPAGHPRHRRPARRSTPTSASSSPTGGSSSRTCSPRLPMVNVHFSLLPRWRGAAPVERALLAGDDVTGVCIMGVEEGLDTGGGLRPPGGADRPDDDRRRAARTSSSTSARELLVDVLAGPLPEPEPQSGEVDVRRRRSRPTSCGSTGTARPPSSTAGSASAGRGRRSAAAG